MEWVVFIETNYFAKKTAVKYVKSMQTKLGIFQFDTIWK